MLLNYFVLRALWKIDVYLISTLVNKSLYYYYHYKVTLYLLPILFVTSYSWKSIYMEESNPRWPYSERLKGPNN